MKTFNFAVPITTRPNVLESLIIENGAKNIVVGLHFGCNQYMRILVFCTICLLILKKCECILF